MWSDDAAPEALRILLLSSKDVADKLEGEPWNLERRYLLMAPSFRAPALGLGNLIGSEGEAT